MVSPRSGEFMGTLVLILRGDGVVAGVLLKRSKAENSGWMVITTAWAFAVFCGVFTAIACGSPEAHLNPAITLAVAIKTGDYSRLIPFYFARVLGAFSGAALVYIHYFPHWRETSDSTLKLATFSTSPAIRNLTWNFVSEAIGTFILVFVVGAIFSKKVSLGGTTGYAINPAPDLGPRIAHALLPIPGKGTSDWGYPLIPVLGPLAGGAIAGYLTKLFAF